MTYKQSSVHRRAFTLTEIAIVLGIIGIILGAIWVAASSLYANFRVNKAVTELMQATQGIRVLYAGAATIGDPAGTDETASFITAGAFPSDMVKPGSTVTDNPWSGTLTATAQTAINAGDMLGLEFTQVPTAACIALLTGTTGTGRDPNLYYATASASPAGASAYGATAAAFPFTAGTATALRTAAPLVAVRFVFKLKG